MSQSYQAGVTSGAEAGHPAQKPNVTADQGITEKANERPDIASNKDTTKRTDTKGDPSVPPNPEEVKEESAKEGGGEGKEGGADPNMDYPEQKHAGEVGYGPNYAEMHGHVTVGERFEGLKKEVKGKIKRDPKLIQEGHDKMTGEAKRKQLEEDQKPTASNNAKPNDSEGGSDDSEKKEAQRDQTDSGDKPVARAAADAKDSKNKPMQEEAARKADQAKTNDAQASRDGQPDDIGQKPVPEGQEVTEAEKVEQHSTSKDEATKPNPPAPHVNTGEQ